MKRNYILADQIHKFMRVYSKVTGEMVLKVDLTEQKIDRDEALKIKKKHERWFNVIFEFKPMQCIVPVN